MSKFFNVFLLHNIFIFIAYFCYVCLFWHFLLLKLMLIFFLMSNNACFLKQYLDDIPSTDYFCVDDGVGDVRVREE